MESIYLARNPRIPHKNFRRFGLQGSDKPGVRESEAAVHGVGGELERLLPDVVLHLLLRRETGVLEQRLDRAPGLHQLPDLGRQHARRRVTRGQLRDEVLVLDNSPVE